MNIIPADIIKMTDKHEKGRALEALSELLLASPLHNATRISTPTPDKGIDRLGQLPDGTYVALQSKAYDSKTVGKHGWQAFSDEVRRVNSDFASGIGEKQITQAVMFATAREGASSNALPSINMLRAEVAVSEWYRDDLLNPDNAYLWNMETERPTPRPPWKHQATAIRDAKKLRKRGKVIMATGTGKTLVATELIKHYGGLCLVLVPNMELVRQVALSITRDAPDAKLLAVFSGEDVRQGLNIMIPATTNPAEIRKFAKTDGLRVVVSTYQSSGKVSEGLRGLTVNFAVLDEAHRTVGGASKTDKGFQVCMNDTGIKIKRRLFMTATPKMHGVKAKEEAEEESYVLYSMDDEEQYGTTLHTLTPGKAIAEGLLAPFDVMAGLFRHARASQYLKKDAKKYARDIGHGLTVEDTYRAAFLLMTAQEENLTRTLVFAANVERARLAAKALNTIAERLGVRAYAHVVSHTSPSDKRREALEDLAHGRFGYDHVFVIQVDLFTEGVDIPALDGVVFIDSRKSTIVIAQAIGRALRLDTANRTKRAKIVIPIMITEKQDIDKVIDKSAFKHIRDYTEAIRDVGFAPEQTVMLAKETGAKTLGDAWFDGEGVEYVKWANSDIDANQKHINAIILGNQSWTMDRLQRLAKLHNRTLIETPIQITATVKITVQCSNGHEFVTTPAAMVQAQINACQQCHMPRWDIDRTQKLLQALGHTVISAPSPLHSYSKMVIMCPKGHMNTSTPSKIRIAADKGQPCCKECSGTVRWTLKRAQEVAATLKYTIVRHPKIISGRTLIDVKCGNGHVFNTTPKKMTKNVQCPQCSPYTSENITQNMLSVGLTVLHMPNVVTSTSSISVICTEGHTTLRPLQNLLENEIGCRVCRGKRVTITPERLRDEMSKIGLTTIGEPSRESNSGDWHVLVRCVNGHETVKPFRSAVKGNGCSMCRGTKIWNTRRNNTPVDQSVKAKLLVWCMSLGHTLIGEATSLLRTTDSITVICKNEHIFTTTPGDIKNAIDRGSVGCKQCSVPPWTLERITNETRSNGLLLLHAPNSITQRSRIKVQCITCGDEFEKMIADGKGGCMRCVRGIWDEARIRSEWAKVGLTPLEVPVKFNSLTKIRSVCAEGHECYQTPKVVRRGCGCPKCGRLRTAEKLRKTVKING